MLNALKGFSKFFTNQRIMIILVIAILGFALYSYGFQKDLIQDNYEGQMEGEMPEMEGEMGPMPEMPEQAMESEEQTDTMKGMKQATKPADLLPNDVNDNFSDFTGDIKKNIQAPDLLTAGANMGTIGQSLRNANQQLRADPVIEKTLQCPWNNSTIEADTSRKPLY